MRVKLWEQSRAGKVHRFYTSDPKKERRARFGTGAELCVQCSDMTGRKCDTFIHLLRTARSAWQDETSLPEPKHWVPRKVPPWLTFPIPAGAERVEPCLAAAVRASTQAPSA